MEYSARPGISLLQTIYLFSPLSLYLDSNRHGTNEFSKRKVLDSKIIQMNWRETKTMVKRNNSSMESLFTRDSTNVFAVL